MQVPEQTSATMRSRHRMTSLPRTPKLDDCSWSEVRQVFTCVYDVVCVCVAVAVAVAVAASIWSQYLHQLVKVVPRVVKP